MHSHDDTAADDRHRTVDGRGPEAVYEFERRMRQCLEACDFLSEGHRRRLQRPLRQADIRCWGEVDEHGLGEAVKVGMRTAAHELLESYCLQIEPAFARCPTSVHKSLLAAMVAHQLALGTCVLFRADNRLTGFSHPAAATLIVEPQAALGTQRVDFLLELRRNAEPFIARPWDDDANDGHEVSMVARLAVSCGEHQPVTVIGEIPLLTLSPDQVIADPFACAAEIWRRISHRL